VKQLGIWFTFALTVALLIGGTAFAQVEPAPAEQPAAEAAPMRPAPGFFSLYLGGAVGGALAAGLIILGAATGISRLGATAVESMARQPEVSGSIQTSMIIAAALIEGITFFALIVAMLAVFRPY